MPINEELRFAGKKFREFHDLKHFMKLKYYLLYLWLQV